ncbi:5804_t:CDS:2 [Dentiscutata erythropus]|uniref:5804_t:CDS:1 n=1 Tax=Dentiscutata erythropus TaxID=1348616 RepID=A0A9N9FJ24_9GLOM|nr:5804_t:CDS:2 [Dentiscutata erythropus]
MSKHHRDVNENTNTKGVMTSLTKRRNKNDVLCQDENATILYEQSFGAVEFDSAHYMRYDKIKK